MTLYKFETRSTSSLHFEDDLIKFQVDGWEIFQILEDTEPNRYVVVIRKEVPEDEEDDVYKEACRLDGSVPRWF
ncbi:hypothetical protein SEA_BELFORT_10 [Streptomyces phage Belfort]|uniref:Uncharacterized protein n=1 Tax=Streptomyces phage Belfort TaxID=2801887 RepID=A0A7T7Z9I9_9CAUD|nr:hypothetical protein SEA_BELFORT_10 [Streptomyces phage Belfort]